MKDINDIINLRNIEAEYLFTGIFGATAFILSIFTGIISGGAIGLVFFKSFLFSAIFSLLGYGCTFTLKKYVPEVYQVLNSLFSGENSENVEVPIDDIPGEKDKPEEDIIEASNEDVKIEEEFEPIDISMDVKSDSYLNVDSEVSNAATNSALPGQSVKKQEFAKYEPKIAAQAIRTWIKKDE